MQLEGAKQHTLHRSHACPVRVYVESLLLTTLEKSSGPRSSRGSLTLEANGPSGKLSPGSLGRF